MSIPANEIVNVQPGTLEAGGNPLSLNGVILSTNPILPNGSLQPFYSPDGVKNYFGINSPEYTQGAIYFKGFENSTQKPGTLYFSPYVLTAAAARLISGPFAGASLAYIQSLTGVLTVTVDGVGFTSSTINLSAATSFSNAATLITAGFTGAGKPTCTWDAVASRFNLVSPTTGVSSTITFATGTLSAGLKFTAANGATVSSGAAIDTPASAMDRVKSITQNWATFTTMFEPDIEDKLAFASWSNGQNQRFLYVGWDTDPNAILPQTLAPNAFAFDTPGVGYDDPLYGYDSEAGFGAIVKALEFNGVMPVYNSVSLASFVLGMVASIDFSRTNARITGAFKSQAGMVPTVTDPTDATNLLNNGYSFYGEYATANDQFNFLYNGQLPGKWKWLDPFVNQIYMNAQFQLALMVLMTSIPSIPYNASGYNLIRAAMIDPINAAINFGGIRAGVVLSSSQKAQVNQAAGSDVASIIETQGYYLQILDPGAEVRQNRGTPIINFWYTDGGAVQKIDLSSVNIF